MTNSTDFVDKICHQNRCCLLHNTFDVRASSHVTFGAGLPLNEHSNLSSLLPTPNTFALPSPSNGETNFGASKVKLSMVIIAKILVFLLGSRDLHRTLTSIESVASGISTPL